MGIGLWALGIGTGYWALGIGLWALGIGTGYWALWALGSEHLSGHWAQDIGHWALSTVHLEYPEVLQVGWAGPRVLSVGHRGGHERHERSWLALEAARELATQRVLALEPLVTEVALLPSRDLPINQLVALSALGFRGGEGGAACVYGASSAFAARAFAVTLVGE